MAKVERVYNVPLRKEWLKVPKYQRAAKAIRALRAFVLRHMKTQEVTIGPFVNMEVWSHGMRNPPHHVKINAVKDDDGNVVIELFGKPMPIITEEKPVEKGAVKKAVEAITGLKVKEKKPSETLPAEAKQIAIPEEKPEASQPSPASIPQEKKPTIEKTAEKTHVKKEKKAKVVRT